MVIGGDSIDELLDRYTDSHADGGGDMRILDEGPESYQAFRDLISGAEHHLHVETLNFDDDTNKPQDMALEFAQLFAAKAREGVQVRIIVDDWQHPRSGGPYVDPVMREAGVEIRNFMPVVGLDINQIIHRQHKKILLADGREVIIGGVNYGWVYFAEGQWRDTNVLLTGPVVTSIQREFLVDWSDLGTPVPDEPELLPALAPTGPLSIRTIDQRPLKSDYDLNNAIRLALRSARERVDIQAAYFNPPDWLLADLVAVGDRGVEVRILMNSPGSIDVADAYAVTVPSFDVLVDHNVRIFLWGLPQTFHSKAMVVDDKFAMIGSHNFNYRSVVWDTENAAIFTDPAAIEAVQAMIDADLAVEGVFEIDRAWVDAELARLQFSGGSILTSFNWLF